ncbi:MAG TPA: glycosyltransferase family 1 protein [Bacteroidetes bacterium]|nr:glycosyltransferase family 1 protein [Bacteroidota bacterium]
MVTISCSSKFHAFALAEQMEKHGLLKDLYTTYAYKKNTFMRRFVSRNDKENIPPEKTHTLVPLAVAMKLMSGENYWQSWNNLFDKWVAKQIANKKDYNIFIGWSGMSLQALRAAKANGKTIILERGSAHIQYQNNILKDEYRRFGSDFKIDPKTIEKELAEYEEADYISIPSSFAKQSFLEHGVAENKLIVNPYGTSSFFQKEKTGEKKRPFRVLYLGSLIIRKGMYYLFEALKQIKIPDTKLEAWFIGKVDNEIKPLVEKYAQPNWTFFGHVNHYDLARYISACDVAVVPSLEDGYGMVVPQMLACGVPVISSANTGGKDTIEEGKNGFIIPIRDPEAIAEKIRLLYGDRSRLEEMKSAALHSKRENLSWDSYGERYAGFINSIKK